MLLLWRRLWCCDWMMQPEFLPSQVQICVPDHVARSGGAGANPVANPAHRIASALHGAHLVESRDQRLLAQDIARPVSLTGTARGKYYWRTSVGPSAVDADLVTTIYPTVASHGWTRAVGAATSAPIEYAGDVDARTVRGHLVRAESVVQPAEPPCWPVLYLSSTAATPWGRR